MALAHLQETADEAEIRAVIHAETKAFIDGNLKAWADCWLHSPLTSDVMVSAGIGVVALRGWDAVYAHMKDTLEREIGCNSKTEFWQENFQITVSGDVAWVLFDGKSLMPRTGLHELFETRILHKVEDGWRIAFSNFVHKRPAAANGTRVAVDADGRIVWMTDEARHRLKSHPGLIVSAGRLRARRPKWGRKLREAFDRAGALHGFFDQFGYISNTGGSFRCPVVLGEDDDGGIITCSVEVVDGLTYVDIGAEDQLDWRLAIAAAIFGLSPAQTSIAREIVSGHSLTGAAEHLGISPTTARTHLTRIFEKTGVNAQPALVRILLSVG